MQFTPTTLQGLFVIDLKKITDDRGYFARAWCRDTLASQGLNPNQTQLNVGYSHKKGTLRGMHFQKAPHAEVKIVRCTRGAVFDVAVDLREDSATRGQWFGVEYASGFFHEFAGWVVYLIAFACLMLVYGLIQLARGVRRRRAA